MSVCLSVCVWLSGIIYSKLHRQSASDFFVHVTYGHGSVFLRPLRRRSDMLCTSGLMDDDIVAHKPRLLDVAAQLKRSAHAAFDLAIKCTQ